MNAKYCVIFFFLIASNWCHGQSDIEFVKDQLNRLFGKDTVQSTQYYEDYSDQLILRVFTQDKNNQLEVRNKSAGKTYDYLPNARQAVGVGFQYKSIGMNLSWSPKFTQAQIDKYGKTRSFDFQTSIYQYDKGFDIGIQSYTGYYLENTVANMNHWEDSSRFYTVPGMQVFNVNFSSFFVLRPHRFSYRPIFLQNGWQKKTGGSLVWGPYMVHTMMRNDSSIIPLSEHAKFKEDGLLRSNTYFALGARIGYGINVVVFKNLFLHTTILLGIDRYMNRVVLKDQARGYTQVGYGSSSMLRMGLGWANAKYTIGIYAVIHGFTQEISNDVSSVSTLNQARFVLARRFSVN